MDRLVAEARNAEQAEAGATARLGNDEQGPPRAKEACHERLVEDEIAPAGLAKGQVTAAAIGDQAIFADGVAVGKLGGRHPGGHGGSEKRD